MLMSHLLPTTPPCPPPPHPQSRIKIRVITERAYHALFMSNMLIRPTPAELDDFGEPEFVIFNAGRAWGWGGGWGRAGVAGGGGLYPTRAGLDDFGEPEFVIFDAGRARLGFGGWGWEGGVCNLRGLMLFNPSTP